MGKELTLDSPIRDLLENTSKQIIMQWYTGVNMKIGDKVYEITANHLRYGLHVTHDHKKVSLNVNKLAKLIAIHFDELTKMEE